MHRYRLFEYIAPYLPYDLKVKAADGTISSLNPINPENNVSLEVVLENNYKPLLRPVNYLITDLNGVAPLLEFVQLTYCTSFSEIPSFWNETYTCNGNTVKFSGKSLDRDLVEFTYDLDANHFKFWINGGQREIYCQYSLYQKLFKHHIDVFKLIEMHVAKQY